MLPHISRGDNYADVMTKALAQTLFYRHMNFIMGQIVPACTYAAMNLVVRKVYDRTSSQGQLGHWHRRIALCAMATHLNLN